MVGLSGSGRKPKAKVEFGEDHVWFVFEAKSVEPGEIVYAICEMVRKTRRKSMQVFIFFGCLCLRLCLCLS